jgi:hypothetical protein
MTVSLNLFRALLVVGWVLTLYVTIGAISSMGASAMGPTFFGDLAHPWRAQFNTDFGFHLLVVAAWLIFRARTLWLGLIWAVLAVNLGGLFTFAYLFAETFLTQGDMRKLLLGRHARP